MPKILSRDWQPYTPHGDMRYKQLANTAPLAEQEVAAAAGASARDVVSSPPAYVAGLGADAPTSNAVYKVSPYAFQHAVAVLMDPVDWAEYNQRAPSAYRLPSYSVYLELTYQDLLESVGMTHAPCPPERQTGFSGDLGSGPGSPYCEAYNLVITSR